MNEGKDFSEYPSTLELRRWGAAKRPDLVPDLGRLPDFVIVAWNRTHPDRQYVKSMGHHGTLSGYHDGCRCLGCGDVGRSRGREVYAMKAVERNEDLADELLEG